MPPTKIMSITVEIGCFFAKANQKTAAQRNKNGDKQPLSQKCDQDLHHCALIIADPTVLKKYIKMERVMRFELTTSTLARSRSTTELHPLINLTSVQARGR